MAVVLNTFTTKLRGRAFCILLSFVVLSCTRPSCWTYREVITDCALYNSALLSHLPNNRFTGIELQFMRGNFGRLGYLNVYARQVPSLANDPCASVVVIAIEEEQTAFKAFRMEGGQRLLLPDEATELLIEALLGCKSITIYLEGFSTDISPDNFPNLYNQLVSLPISSSP